MTQLTPGQQGVLHMYDSEIQWRKRNRDFAEKLGNYDDVQYETERIEGLQAERAETLAQFMAQHAGTR